MTRDELVERVARYLGELLPFDVNERDVAEAAIAAIAFGAEDRLCQTLGVLAADAFVNAVLGEPS